MKNNELTITISGSTGTGKSCLTFLLKKYLKENGFETEFNSIDFDSEAQFDLQYNQNFDKVIENIKMNTKVIFKEIQTLQEPVKN